MARVRIKAITWETTVLELQQEEMRHMIRRRKNKSPYIRLKDTKTGSEASLKPLTWEVTEDITQAANISRLIGDYPFPTNKEVEELIQKLQKGESLDSSGAIYNWDEVLEILDDHLASTMKASSAKNVRSDIRNLYKQGTPFIWQKVKAWVFQKDVSSRPFRNRLDALEQLRLAISNKFGDEPEWLMRKELVTLRDQHKSSSSKSTRYQPGADISGVRAIPTIEEAEKYLDHIGEDYPLEQWCLAMQMCYGLRNHELHHCSPITKLDLETGMAAGWLYIPGTWRTKSKFEHWTFPLVPSWIERYKLSENFETMQFSLTKRAKPKIVSALNMKEPWDPSNDNDLGVCINNDYLGSFITKRLRDVLPAWKAGIPDARGQSKKAGKRIDIKPYDLRHTWAVRVSTAPEWNHVDENVAASAMGHDLATHRKHYQKWISIDETRKTLMKKVQLPSL